MSNEPVKDYVGRRDPRFGKPRWKKENEKRKKWVKANLIEKEKPKVSEPYVIDD